jgi:hypothetical protein
MSFGAFSKTFHKIIISFSTSIIDILTKVFFFLSSLDGLD